MKSIDCRGLSCPEPVLRTKKVMSDNPGQGFTVLVDNETARENVLRFIRSQKRQAEWIEKVDHFLISSKAGDIKQDEAGDQTPGPGRPVKGNAVVFISSDQLGQGSSELGQMLMRNFIYTLTKRDELPRAVVFMNSGVRLSIKGSPAIEELQDLESKGVEILVCGTCLDYYALKDQLFAGQVSNMYDIADLLMTAENVTSL